MLASPGRLPVPIALMERRAVHARGSRPLDPPSPPCCSPVLFTLFRTRAIARMLFSGGSSGPGEGFRPKLGPPARRLGVSVLSIGWTQRRRRSLSGPPDGCWRAQAASEGNEPRSPEGFDAYLVICLLVGQPVLCNNDAFAEIWRRRTAPRSCRRRCWRRPPRRRPARGEERPRRPIAGPKATVRPSRTPSSIG